MHKLKIYKKIYILKIVALIFISTFYSCSTNVVRQHLPSDTSYNFDSGIHDSNYVLEILDDKKITKEDYMKDIPHLRFNTKEGTVHGSSGCNILSGEVKISGDEISFLNLALTRMMCPGDGEANFLSALKNAKTFKTANGKIYLLDNMRTLAVFGKER